MGDTHALRVISIATASFRSVADRMLRSLASIHPDAIVDIYVDDPDAFRNLPHPRASVHQHADIAERGVKRAKLTAYEDAARGGSFVYLDADVVVLDRLDELLDPTDPYLTACRDDLDGCPFIHDRQHPWPGDPQLFNQRYVNTGVMGFGRSMLGYLEDLRRRGDDDAFWNRYIHPDGLFDNHVFCAYLNLVDVPLRTVSERRFNWQGLRRPDGSCCAERRHGSLWNIDSGERLHVVHFAGVRDVDRYLTELPLEVGRHINAASTEARDVGAALSSIQASPQGIDRAPVDYQRERAAEVITRACLATWDVTGEWASERYLPNADEVVSVALSVPQSSVRWNDLLCGGAYLEPAEYAALRAAVSRARPHTIVEFGAGETTRLLAGLAPWVISLEPASGPWVARAMESGAQVEVAPLDDEGRFAASALAAIPLEVDFLFVDSPNGTQRRAVVLRQLLERVRPTRIAVHDSRRDLFVLTGELEGHGYVIEETYMSFRGLTILRHTGAAPMPPTTSAHAVLTEFRARIDPGDTRIATNDRQTVSLSVRIENTSTQTWPNCGAHPVRLSYHLAVGGQTLVFDGRRTPLPCEMAPGDVVDLPVVIDIPQDLVKPALVNTEFEAFVTLVQEGVAWFDANDPNLGAGLTIDPQFAKS